VASRSGAPSSDGDDLQQLVGTGEVRRIAGVELSAVGVCGGGDEQVHRSRPRSAPGGHDRGGESSVAGGDGVVDGQGLEAALDDGDRSPVSAFDQRSGRAPAWWDHTIA